jgi:hypothetical protein
LVSPSSGVHSRLSAPFGFEQGVVFGMQGDQVGGQGFHRRARQPLPVLGPCVDQELARLVPARIKHASP